MAKKRPKFFENGQNNQIMGVARLVFCKPPLVYKDENLKCLGSTLTSIRETGEKV